MTSEQVLQEILEKIENNEDVRCFCPGCGEMSMLTFGWVPCPYGCGGAENCEWEGYTCPSCFYRYTLWYDVPASDDLLKYNILRFSV